MTTPYIGRDTAYIQLPRLVRPLLEQMLARVLSCQDTPLQFEIDSAGIASAAWNCFIADISENDMRFLSDGEQLCAMLDQLIEEALAGESDAAVACERVVTDGAGRSAVSPASDLSGKSAPSNRLQLLAEWFDRICSSFRTVHPQAVQVVGLRVEGYSSRETAERLGTGLRLVRRVLSDSRGQYKQLAQPR